MSRLSVQTEQSSRSSHSKHSERKSKDRKKKEAIDYGMAKYLVRGLEEFEGKPSEDVDVWVDRFAAATKTLDEQCKMVEFVRNLGGQAKIWFNRQTISDKERGSKPTSSDWCARLRKEFTVAPHEHEKNEAAYTQRYGQSARDYVQEKLALIDLAHKGYDDARKVRRLLSGVHSAYIDRMEGHISTIVHNEGIDKITVFRETLDDVMRVHDRAIHLRSDQPGTRARVFNVEESSSIVSSDWGSAVDECLILPENSASNVGAGARSAATAPSDLVACAQEAARLVRMEMQMTNTFPAGNPYQGTSGGMGQQAGRLNLHPNQCIRCRQFGHRAINCPYPRQPGPPNPGYSSNSSYSPSVMNTSTAAPSFISQQQSTMAPTGGYPQYQNQQQRQAPPQSSMSQVGPPGQGNVNSSQ